MSRGFGTLIYTDCRPGQGLRGDTGLQFQARSDGVGASEMDAVQRALLYEVPVNWVSRCRPLEEYPASLAHVWDPATGVLGTAQGVYLGREANGLREGNQLTHAVVTTDPDSYGLVRPAQLLHVPFWTREPAPTTECPRLADGWQPGMAEPEIVRDFVAAHKDGRALLVTLLSALFRMGEPHPDRVMFIAERPEEVLQWITAATLLLPQRQALTIGFKVFTTNPGYCPQPVLAVHPDWAGPYRSAGTSAGFVVLDLISRSFTDVPADELAERWVDLFLSSDLYDVMDAVELASVVAEAGAAPKQAAAVALAVTLGGRAGAVTSRWRPTGWSTGRPISYRTTARRSSARCSARLQVATCGASTRPPRADGSPDQRERSARPCCAARSTPRWQARGRRPNGSPCWPLPRRSASSRSAPEPARS